MDNLCLTSPLLLLLYISILPHTVLLYSVSISPTQVSGVCGLSEQYVDITEKKLILYIFFKKRAEKGNNSKEIPETFWDEILYMRDRWP